ncbi:hypothetical protein DIPPA_34229 [Diplonema papillatum]|nr:hypothetical protein DIPPA_34229 [Diplonema papillatum]
MEDPAVAGVTCALLLLLLLAAAALCWRRRRAAAAAEPGAKGEQTGIAAFWPSRRRAIDVRDFMAPLPASPGVDNHHPVEAESSVRIHMEDNVEAHADGVPASTGEDRSGRPSYLDVADPVAAASPLKLPFESLSLPDQGGAFQCHAPEFAQRPTPAAPRIPPAPAHVQALGQCLQTGEAILQQPKHLPPATPSPAPLPRRQEQQGEEEEQQQGHAAALSPVVSPPSLGPSEPTSQSPRVCETPAGVCSPDIPPPPSHVTTTPVPTRRPVLVPGFTAPAPVQQLCPPPACRDGGDADNMDECDDDVTTLVSSPTSLQQSDNFPAPACADPPASRTTRNIRELEKQIFPDQDIPVPLARSSSHVHAQPTATVGFHRYNGGTAVGLTAQNLQANQLAMTAIPTVSRTRKPHDLPVGRALDSAAPQVSIHAKQHPPASIASSSRGGGRPLPTFNISVTSGRVNFHKASDQPPEKEVVVRDLDGTPLPKPPARHPESHLQPSVIPYGSAQQTHAQTLRAFANDLSGVPPPAKNKPRSNTTLLPPAGHAPQHGRAPASPGLPPLGCAGSVGEHPVEKRPRSMTAPPNGRHARNPPGPAAQLAPASPLLLAAARVGASRPAAGSNLSSFSLRAACGQAPGHNSLFSSAAGPSPRGPRVPALAGHGAGASLPAQSAGVIENMHVVPAPVVAADGAILRAPGQGIGGTLRKNPFLFCHLVGNWERKVGLSAGALPPPIPARIVDGTDVPDQAWRELDEANYLREGNTAHASGYWTAFLGEMDRLRK